MNSSKKAQSEYLSWIMIFGLVMMLSYVLYNWSIEQAKLRSQEIEQRTDPLVCADVALSVKGSCQTYSVLYLNITNPGKLALEGLSFRFIGVHPDEETYLQSQVLFDQLTTGDTEKLKVLKHGTLSQITVIPIAKKKGKYIYCEEQAVVREVNELKQC